MSSRAVGLFVFCAALSPLAADALSLLPLEVEDAVLLPSGTLEIALGADAAFDVRPAFRDFERDGWRGPALAIRAGLGERAEVLFEYDLLHVSDAVPIDVSSASARFEGSNRGSESGTGDARLFTKIAVLSAGDYGRPWLPDASLRFGVKFPNANDRLGTDQADVFGEALLARDARGVRWFANLGAWVLGNPGISRGQDDVFRYAFGAIVPGLVDLDGMRLSPAVEISGLSGSRFDNDRSSLTAGVRLWSRLVTVYGGARFGLGDRKDEFGFLFGVLRRFDVFGPAVERDRLSEEGPMPERATDRDEPPKDGGGDPASATGDPSE